MEIKVRTKQQFGAIANAPIGSKRRPGVGRFSGPLQRDRVRFPRGLLESMRDYYRTKAAEFYARARNESDVITRRQYESLASQYSRIAEIADRGRDRRTVYASHRQLKSGVKHN
jgi:hypothetical protein